MPETIRKNEQFKSIKNVGFSSQIISANEKLVAF